MENYNYVKINKGEARKRFDKGETIYLVGCNVSSAVFYSDWSFIKPVEIHKSQGLFLELLDSFIYYNCNSETGIYPHYYVKEEI